MEYEVVLTLKAEQDIDEAFTWYEEVRVYRIFGTSLNPDKKINS